MIREKDFCSMITHFAEEHGAECSTETGSLAMAWTLSDMSVFILEARKYAFADGTVTYTFTPTHLSLGSIADRILNKPTSIASAMAANTGYKVIINNAQDMKLGDIKEKFLEILRKIDEQKVMSFKDALRETIRCEAKPILDKIELDPVAYLFDAEKMHYQDNLFLSELASTYAKLIVGN